MSARWLVGIDGWLGGWVAVAQPEASGPSGAVRAVVAQRLESSLAEFDGLRLAGIDMPMGPIRGWAALV